MKYSIIIPTYNRPDMLLKAVERVKKIKQAEIIVVDDGSTAESSEKLKGVQGINLITQENRGLSSARNTGINNAIGEYIFFLDDDDDISDKFIEFCNTFRATQNIYRFNANKVNLDGDIIKNYYNHKNTRILKKQNRWYSCNVATFLLKRKFIIENKLFFDEEIKYGEDMPWSSQIWLTLEKQTTINIPSLIYLVDDRNISLTNQKKYSPLRDITEINSWNRKIDNIEIKARQWLALKAVYKKTKKEEKNSLDLVKQAIGEIVRGSRIALLKTLPPFERFEFIFISKGIFTKLWWGK